MTPDGSGPSTRPRLLMVMPYRQLVRKARAAGFWVCSVWDPTFESADYLADVRAASDAFHTADFGDELAMRSELVRCARLHGVDLLYGVGRDVTHMPTHTAAAELDLAVNSPESVHVLTDKAAMRALLARHSLSPVRTRTVGDVADVSDAVGEIGAPAVVKPVAGSGSRGVFLWEGAQSGRHWRLLAHAQSLRGPFLVEEFLRGPEFSVETLSVAGVHHVIGVTAKTLGPRPHFVEMAHHHPADVTAVQRSALEQVTTALLDAAGYRTGPAHTEVILTEAGPRIVESQARLGGDRIPRLIELATGYDIEAGVFDALLGNAPVVGPPTATATIRYLDIPVGCVTSVEGVDVATVQAGVDDVVVSVAAGDRIEATRDSRSRHGHVITVGETRAMCDARADRAAATLSILVDPPLVTAGPPAWERASRPAHAMDGDIVSA